MTASPSITGSVSSAIYPSGSLVPVRQAVGSATPLETYSTANRPAVIICRIQFSSAAPHGGMLARIERHSSRAVLASSGFAPAGLNLFGLFTAARRLFCALAQPAKQSGRSLSNRFHRLLWLLGFHTEQQTTGAFLNDGNSGARPGNLTARDGKYAC